MWTCQCSAYLKFVLTMHTHAHTHTCMHACTHTHTHTHACTHIHFKFILTTHTHAHTACAHHTHTRTHTHILIPFEDRRPTGLKVDIAHFKKSFFKVTQWKLGSQLISSRLNWHHTHLFGTADHTLHFSSFFFFFFFILSFFAKNIFAVLLFKTSCFDLLQHILNSHSDSRVKHEQLWLTKMTLRFFVFCKSCKPVPVNM